MPIDFNGLGHTQNTKTRSLDTAPSKSRPAAVAQDAVTQATEKKRGENLVLSDKAKALKDMENELKSKPDVDSDKVAKVKAALENGTYDLNPQKLAQKMLDFDKSIF